MLYTKENLEAFRLKENQDSFAAKLLPSDFSSFATNFKTDNVALTLGSKSMLCTVNEKEYDNSPICSPYNLFCLYPKKRLQGMKRKILKRLLTLCTILFQFPFKTTQFNKVLQVNNKPCDAILYPEMSAKELKNCLNQLLKSYPKHAILFPRIDRMTHTDLFDALENAGFWMVPTRPVHIFDPSSNYMSRSHTKRDFTFLKKQSYQFVPHEEISNEELPRIHELYQKLFIEKHSKENPNLTLKYFQESHANRWYDFFALRNEKGGIDAFFSYEIEGKSMACGPLGYDTSLAPSAGLYRMLFAHSLRIAKEKGCLFNFGGGNEHFKSNRGSQREIGFTAVYCKHLPKWRQFPWWLLGKAGKNLTLKIMRSSTF